MGNRHSDRRGKSPRGKPSGKADGFSDIRPTSAPSEIDDAADRNNWVEALEDNEWADQLNDLLEGQDVLPFMAALQPLIAAGLVKDLKTYAEKAEKKAKAITKQQKDLWVDGIAMIRLYTMQWKNSSQSFYAALKHAMSDCEGRRSLDSFSKWVPAIKLFDEALVRLPERYHISGRVFRGTSYRYPNKSQPNVVSHWVVHDLRFIFGFNSHSVDRATAEKAFGGADGTIFSVNLRLGYTIAEFSAYRDENEVLARPLTLFKVVGSVEGPPDIVQLAEQPRPQSNNSEGKGKANEVTSGRVVAKSDASAPKPTRPISSAAPPPQSPKPQSEHEAFCEKMDQQDAEFIANLHAQHKKFFADAPDDLTTLSPEMQEHYAKYDKMLTEHTEKYTKKIRDHSEHFKAKHRQFCDDQKSAPYPGR